jgi:hypothetical protein
MWDGVTLDGKDMSFVLHDKEKEVQRKKKAEAFVFAMNPFSSMWS